jgi:hypothetical protein
LASKNTRKHPASTKKTGIQTTKNQNHKKQNKHSAIRECHATHRIIAPRRTFLLYRINPLFTQPYMPPSMLPHPQQITL